MHTLGGIDGKTYTNSLEAFNYNYFKRNRLYFEIDFSLTSDDEIMAYHGDCKFDKLVLNKKEVESIIKEKGYTPLDLDGAIELMNKHKDIYLIFDIKHNYDFIIKKIIEEIKRNNPEILTRTILQVYTPQDYYSLKKHYNFDRVIYSLYKSNISNKNAVKFILENKDIKIVTSDKNCFLNKLFYPNHKNKCFTKSQIKDLKNNNKEIFVNTVNNSGDILRCLEEGVNGIFTDFY